MRQPRPSSPAAGLLATASLVCALLLGGGSAAAEPRRHVIDRDHVSVGFLVKHIGFASVLGLFREVEGAFVYDDEARSVTDIRATIKAASVFTNHEARDGHLRSKDFLWAEDHPDITFVGTGAEATSNNTGTVTGDLTIRGVTRPVTLDVTLNRAAAYPYGDKHWAIGISARATILRSEFGMTYAQGGFVGDEVEIILEFEAIRQE